MNRREMIIGTAIPIVSYLMPIVECHVETFLSKHYIKVSKTSDFLGNALKLVGDLNHYEDSVILTECVIDSEKNLGYRHIHFISLKSELFKFLKGKDIYGASISTGEYEKICTVPER